MTLLDLSRREFLKALAAVTSLPFLQGIDLDSDVACEEAWKAAVKQPLLFDVDGDGYLALADFREPTKRSDVYAVHSQLIKTLDDLKLDAGSCQPLAWMLDEHYQEFRVQLQELAEYPLDTEPLLKSRRWGYLSKEERDWEKWPDQFYGQEDLLDRWCSAYGEKRFINQIKPLMEKWQDEEPDEDPEYFDCPHCGENYAYRFFAFEHGIDPEIGVTVIEGDFPGSNFTAAQLTKAPDEANRICEAQGIPLRFRRA